MALLRTSMGDAEEARRLFAEALSISESLPDRPLWERVKENQSRLLDETAPE